MGCLRIEIAVLPLQSTTRWLGSTIRESGVPILEPQVTNIKRIQWVIAISARRTPLDSACLVQALTGATLEWIVTYVNCFAY